VRHDTKTSDLLDHLSSFVDAERAHLGISGAWLFGSYASGSHHGDSDIDLEIVTEQETSLDEEIDFTLGAKRLGPSIEVHFFPRSEFDHARRGIFEDIQQKGILIS
jgi:predicted nucleotidyltransferase